MTSEKEYIYAESLPLLSRGEETITTRPRPITVEACFQARLLHGLDALVANLLMYTCMYFILEIHWSSMLQEGTKAH